MNNKKARSIMEMARGAFLEKVDYEMARVMENILDANTSATAKRRLTVTLEFKPDDSRQNVAVGCSVKPTLAPANPSTTFLYVADGENIVEMAPQVPGQMCMDGSEQEPPAALKIIKFA